jgi:general secretion pathway protein M
MLPELQTAARQDLAPSADQMLEGNSDAIAGAALQERVQELASAAHAKLISIETLPGEEQGTYRLIAVRLELRSQLAVLVDLLTAIEEGPPTMLVKDIQIKVGSVSPANPYYSLENTFTVYAFRNKTLGGLPQ